MAWRAFVLRDWRIARSYRFAFVLGFAATFIGMALYFFLSGIVRSDSLPKGAGRNQGYFAYALVGVVALDVLAVGLITVARGVREEQTTGTLEAVLSTPAPTWLVAFGLAAYETMYGLVSGALAAVAGVVVFNVHFDMGAADIGVFAATAFATFVLVGCLGIALAALTVVVKQTATVAALMATALAILSGAYFPVSVLPEPLRSLSVASPFRWSLDIMRAALFGGDVPVEELLGLFALTAATVPIAFGVFHAALQHARRNGSLGHY